METNKQREWVENLHKELVTQSKLGRIDSTLEEVLTTLIIQVEDKEKKAAQLRN